MNRPRNRITIPDVSDRYMTETPNGISEKLKTPDGTTDYWNIFVPGTKIGIYHFAKYKKDYVYAHMPKSDAKVFLRCVVFLRIEGDTRVSRFVIVHRWDDNMATRRNDDHTWEPIKGQVESKELAAARRLAGKGAGYNKTVLHMLHYTILRELEEEAKIAPTAVKKLRFHPEIAYSSRHSDYPEKNMYYQYQFFTATISADAFRKAGESMVKYVASPQALLGRKDDREKDAVSIWNSQMGFNALMWGTPSAIVRLYLRNAKLLTPL